MIKNSVIFLLIIALFISYHYQKERTKIVTTIDTVINYKTFVNYKKGELIPFRVLDTIYKTSHDTTFIVQDYNAAKEYTDSIHQDSNLFVIRDTISQNKIIGRSFEAKIKEKTITITNTIQPSSKTVLFLGLRSDFNTKVQHSVNIYAKVGKKSLYSVGYGTNGLSLGYAIKL